MGWLSELFCPEHGLPVLLEAWSRYGSHWFFMLKQWSERHKRRQKEANTVYVK